MNKLSRLTFRQIQCFLEVCRDFHFSNAARRLGLTQPPLSRSIKDLESVVGAQLFIRNPKKVQLTPAGHAFLDEIYQLPALLNRAIASANRADKGESSFLKVGFVGALLGNELLSSFENFRAANPDIQLKLIDDSPAQLVEQLSREEIDIGFLGITPQSTAPQIACLPWRTDRLCACVPRSSPLAQLKTVSLQKLSTQKLVALTANGAPAYRELIDLMFDSTPRKPAIVHQTDSVPTLVSLVVAGLGLALLPESMIAAARKHVATIPIRSSKAKIRNTLVYRKNNSKPELKRFLESLQN